MARKSPLFGPVWWLINLDRERSSSITSAISRVCVSCVGWSLVVLLVHAPVQRPPEITGCSSNRSATAACRFGLRLPRPWQWHGRRRTKWQACSLMRRRSLSFLNLYAHVRLHEAFFHQSEWGSEVDRSLQQLKRMGHSTLLGNVMPVQGWIPAWSQQLCRFGIERRLSEL